MPKATINADTFLKKHVLAANDLPDANKIFMEKGKTFSVTEFSPDRNQHIRLTLASPLTAKDGKTKLQEVYAYDPHITLEGEDAKQVIKLDVPYYCQLNNDPTFFGDGSRQCNTTSNTMLADFLLKGDISKQAKQQGFPEPESVYMRLVNKYGDTTEHPPQTEALKDLGIESYYTDKLSGKDVLRSLKAGIPVVAGVAYKSGGHILVIVGHDPIKKVWLMHDPFGTRYGYSDSYDKGFGGKYDAYTYGTMQMVFWDRGGEAGAGRIVTSIKGKSTGLPSGL